MIERMSVYPVNEAPPTNEQLHHSLSALIARAKTRPPLLRQLQQYVRKWICWLKCGLARVEAFIPSMHAFLPCLSSCDDQGPVLKLAA